MTTIILYGKLPSLNDYTYACRSHWSKGAKFKKEVEENIERQLLQYRFFRINEKVILNYHWIEPNKKRDLDNIMSAQKFIQDSLVSMGILQNDGWANIGKINHSFSVDKNNPRIEITITRFEE